VLGDGSSQLSPAERGRLALIPGEVSARLGLLGRPVLVDGQADRMREYLRCLHRGAMILSAAAGQSADWPAGMKQEPAYVKAVSLESDFREQLLANEKLIDGRTAPADSVAQFETAFNAKKSAIADLCRENAPRLPPAQWLNLLAFCRRMEEAGETILRATRLCSELDWSALKKDSSL
jgi:hypothetical protein